MQLAIVAVQSGSVARDLSRGYRLPGATHRKLLVGSPTVSLSKRVRLGQAPGQRQLCSALFRDTLRAVLSHFHADSCAEIQAGRSLTQPFSIFWSASA